MPLFIVYHVFNLNFKAFWFGNFCLCLIFCFPTIPDENICRDVTKKLTELLELLKRDLELSDQPGST